MNKNIRHISMTLAIFMVLSLLAAFPALSVGAEDPVNLALTSTYRAAEPSSTNGISGKFSEENMTAYADWNAYHTGKLADGTFTTEATNSTDRATIEIAGGASVAAKTGNITIYFKLAKESTISSANIFANDRASNYRGYADSYSVYVGNSEDVTAATLLGTVTEDTYTAYQESATAREYVVTGETALTGTYVILQCAVDSVAVGPDDAKGIIALMEVQIWGNEIADTESSSEDASSEENTSEESSSDDSSSEAPVTPSNPLINVAPNAEYKGDGEDNGTSGKYCDDGNWEEYHQGKLNDGIIPETDAGTSLYQNVEFWLTGVVGGTAYVYFKFEEEINVKEVIAYMNYRVSSSNNRSYPEKVNVYVGTSEDVTAATLLGEATTTDPEGAVRAYSVSGDATGTYVIFEFTISDDKPAICLSEVEIMVEDTPVNHAPNAEYKGDGEDNGTSGKYCDDGNWEEYHQGKLNDGIIPETDAGTSLYQNVEFWLTGVVGGTAYVYFKFDYEVDVREVIAYMNYRTSSSNNRSYPEKVNVYVGNSEDVTAATLLGEATTTDPEGAVRAYSVSGAATGTYVIFEFTISDAKPAICLSEVEIMGFGEVPVVELPALSAPVLSGNLTKMETYEAPTITWEAVEGAVSYDAYIDGKLVTEGITGTSYVPDMDPVIGYSGNTSYTKVQIVAKGDGITSGDSELSESYNFFYVEMPLDLRGNRVSSADILIDPGHGGQQPGACLDERQEKADTLAMSLKLGEYFEALGYTVAYTRIEDVDDGLMSRAAKANAGEYKLFICVHRNAFNGLAKGIETLYETGDAVDEAFAQKVQDEFIALNLFTNRGLKPRDNLVVTNNVADTIPCILVELGFIDNVDDNAAFDTYFDDIALAIVKGSMNYLGDNTGVIGTVTVEGTDYTIGETESVDVALDEENTAVTIKGTLTSAFGVSALLSAIGEEEAAEITFTVNTDGSVSFELELDFSDYEEGTYTIVINGKNAFAEKALILNGFDVITVNVSVPSDRLLGDVNNDGVVDNIDAAMVLQYDANIISEIDMVIGDVNFDGEVDSLDAAYILRYEAGIIDGFVKPEEDTAE